MAKLIKSHINFLTNFSISKGSKFGSGSSSRSWIMNDTENARSAMERLSQEVAANAPIRKATFDRLKEFITITEDALTDLNNAIESNSSRTEIRRLLTKLLHAGTNMETNIPIVISEQGELTRELSDRINLLRETTRTLLQEL